MQVYTTNKYENAVIAVNTREPTAQSLFWHGAQIGGLRVFPVIKITLVHQVSMLPASTAVQA